jgi:hypothetical protein
MSTCPPRTLLTSQERGSAKADQLAAEAGTTARELMRRIGHSTVRAAVRYQHSTDRRDREIAAEMSRRAGLARLYAGEQT